MTTEKRICRWCSEWIELLPDGWQHVGGDIRCHSEAEPMLTIREHAGLDPIPGEVPESG
jgi:hypothetical protein